MPRRVLLLLALAAVFLGAAAAGAEGPVRERLRARVQERMEGRTETRGGGALARLAGLDVAYWLPDAGAYPAPLVIFSHGLYGCKTQSVFLMQALAQNGYIAVAPGHQDASCGGGSPGRPQERLARYDDWSDRTYAGRAADIKNLFAALQADKVWARRIDWAHVALAGHSLGGYTAVGLAGGWPSWKMEGIQAVLALSPYVGPLLKGGGIARIGVPVMYQTGTRDLGVKPSVSRAGGAFDQTPSPAWLVEFRGTGHFGWTDLQKGSQGAIVRYSLWFLDRTLKGSDAPLFRDENGVADLRAK